MSRGVFISFEGSEGCGKSTQLKLLAGALENAGHQVVTTREPGGTPLGEEIRHLLQFSEKGHGMASETELLLFTASRAELTRRVIHPALAAGKIVLADRYLDSTTVYQGVARRLAAEDVARINAFAIGNRLPDLTLIFDLAPEVARERLNERVRPAGAPDRMESQPHSFYEAVREGYLALAQREPARVKTIDAAPPPDEVERAVRSVLNSQLRGLLPN